MVVPTPSNKAIAHAEAGNGYAEGWESFALLALSSLGRELYEDGAGLVVVHEPEGDGGAGPRRKWTGKLTKLLRRSGDGKADSTLTVDLEAESPDELLRWVFDRLADEDRLPRYVPAGEPQTVHEITHRLFSAYEVDGGSLHLGGCHIENVPFLRVTEPADAGGDPIVVHRFFDARGELVDEALVGQLHLTDVQPPADQILLRDRSEWTPIIDSLGGDQTTSKAIALVLAKRASGRLELTIGEESLSIPFEGWMRTLAASPAVCPQTGAESFQLTALSDGRIAAKREVVTCDESGQAILKQDAVHCSVTGKTVGKEHAEKCPVSGEPTLAEGFVVCRRCGQRVSQVVVTKTGCQGCDRVAPANEDDSIVNAIVAAAPKLADKKLKVAETDAVWIATTGSLLTRLIVVVDKATKQISHAAKRRRFSSEWRELSPAEHVEQLGSPRD